MPGVSRELRSAVGGRQYLTGFECGVAYRFGIEGRSFDGGLSFHIIESPWAGLVCVLPEGSRA